MKKLLLGLGSIAAVIAPVAAVISCGDDAKKPATDTTTTTGEATITVALTAPASGTKIQLSDDVTKVTTNADFGTSTTAANITLNGATLHVTFSANATQDTIKAAITTAVTSNSAFTNCFEASAS